MPRVSWDPKITLGNVLTIISMLIALALGYTNLKLEAQASATAIVALQADVSELDDVHTRLAVVERNQVTGREAREAFQAQMTEAVADLNRQLLQISTQLAGISARLDERDRVINTSVESP